MPTYKTAKDIAENALSIIGAFPSSQSQADESELKRTLDKLETILNFETGTRPLAGYWRIVDIPLEAGKGDYYLDDYEDCSGTQSVFSISLANTAYAGYPDLLYMMYEDDAILEDYKEQGTPSRVLVTKDKKPIIKVFPAPTQEVVDSGNVLRLRIQTYSSNIDPRGNADIDLKLRPAWYLWAENRTAYEIGKGPVRKLGETELERLQKDYEKFENMLQARDGKTDTGKPPVVEAYGEASITYSTSNDIVNHNYVSIDNGYRRKL